MIVVPSMYIDALAANSNKSTEDLPPGLDQSHDESSSSSSSSSEDEASVPDLKLVETASSSEDEFSTPASSPTKGSENNNNIEKPKKDIMVGSSFIFTGKANSALRRVRHDRRGLLRRLESQSDRLKELESELAILKSQQVPGKLQETLAGGSEKVHDLRVIDEDEGEAAGTKDEQDDSKEPLSAAQEQSSRPIVVGSTLLQEEWNQDHTVDAAADDDRVQFPTPHTFTCAPKSEAEERENPTWMPGYCTKQVMKKGLYTVTLQLQGGYGGEEDAQALVGLVSTDVEKEALKVAGSSSPLLQFSFLTLLSVSTCTVTIHVDMLNHRAELFVMREATTTGGSNNAPVMGKQEPHQVWEQIPDELWVAVAIQQSSSRRKVRLLPSTHWDV